MALGTRLKYLPRPLQEPCPFVAASASPMCLELDTQGLASARPRTMLLLAWHSAFLVTCRAGLSGACTSYAAHVQEASSCLCLRMLSQGRHLQAGDHRGLHTTTVPAVARGGSPTRCQLSTRSRTWGPHVARGELGALGAPLWACRAACRWCWCRGSSSSHWPWGRCSRAWPCQCRCRGRACLEATSSQA